MTNIQIEKLARILQGEKVIASNDDMNLFEQLAYDDKITGLASVRNPDQIGTRDCWLAYIIPEKLSEAQAMARGQNV